MTLPRPARAFLCALACAGMAIAPGHAQGAGPSWYGSDALGSTLAPLSAEAAAAAGWALRVDRTGLSERSTLFQNGAELRSWTRDFLADGRLARERIEESGIVLEDTRFNGDGTVSGQTIRLGDGSLEERVYAYSDGRLAKVGIRVGDAPERTLSYVYGPDGRLLSLRDSAGRSAGSAPSGGASWYLDGVFARLIGFDAGGKQVSALTYRGASLVSSEFLAWEGGVLASRRITELERVRETLVEYDRQGRAYRETVTSKGAIISETGTVYDADGRKLRVEYRGKDSTRATEYEYAADGTLALQRDWTGGLLSSVLRWNADGERVEELYDGGTLFAVVRYRDGRKTAEQIIRDGVVVRERSFP